MSKPKRGRPPDDCGLRQEGCASAVEENENGGIIEGQAVSLGILKLELGVVCVSGEGEIYKYIFYFFKAQPDRILDSSEQN